jgi:hypothetical protein
MKHTWKNRWYYQMTLDRLRIKSKVKKTKRELLEQFYWKDENWNSTLEQIINKYYETWIISSPMYNASFNLWYYRADRVGYALKKLWIIKTK